MVVRPLPIEALQVLAKLTVPPRLVGHLSLVDDAASEILEGLRDQCPDLKIDADAVQFGAAIHDVGKVLHPAELTGPGNLHEQDGLALLQQLGVSQERSRFARTHGTWMHEAELTLDDLLVALADHVWKGSRSESLESKIAEGIADELGLEPWEAFLGLDEILTKIANRSEERLAW